MAKTSAGNSTPDENADPIMTFLNALFGDAKSGYVLLWTKEAKRSYWIPVSDLDQAKPKAAELSITDDLYAGVGLRQRDLGRHARGKGGDVVGIPGLWRTQQNQTEPIESERVS